MTSRIQAYQGFLDNSRLYGHDQNGLRAPYNPTLNPNKPLANRYRQLERPKTCKLVILLIQLIIIKHSNKKLNKHHCILR